MGRSLGLRMLGALGVMALFSAAALPESPIADAAMQGDREAVKALLQEGVDVNAPQGDGMTALHWAALNGDTELAKLLLSAGAHLEAITRIGAHTPLHVASRAGNVEAVRALLAAGARVNATTTTGITPLHLAALAGDPRLITALLDKGAEVDAREPGWGQTPLMLAAARNRAQAITLLIERGADVNAAQRQESLVDRMAVDQAAREARDAVMDAFKTQSPAGELWRPDPSQVQAAVRAAREVERAARASGASRGGDEGGGGDEGNPGFALMVGVQGGLTPLLMAVREGHQEAVEALLRGGAQVNQARAGDETSPILLAAINGHFDLVKLLLERGADPNQASVHGATPLYAVINKQWAPSSRHPQPTYHLQQKIGYMELMETLLEAGADPNVRLTSSLWYTTYDRDNLRVDFVGATPFWRAAYGTDVPAMKLLLAHGADPDIPTQKPAGRAGRGRRGGGDGNEEDPSGLPPVPDGGPGIPPIIGAAGAGYGRGYAANDHNHAPDAWLSTARFLIEELGAPVNARDHEGFTALHYAAARGDNELIEYLVSKGGDVTLVTRTGQTTADMANGPVQRISPFLETVELLEKLGSKNNHNCVGC